ncbi:putative 2-aminoethylphosphonate ABC transporter ATP-binding protein [Alcaligenes sp. Marseille-Q7550]
MSANPAFLSIQGLHKQFGSFTALDQVSLDIQAGELVCLLGPSGCGKTTLLRCIAGLQQADRGAIIMAGRDISLLPPQQRDYGILFQACALFPTLTVAQNIASGVSPRRRLADQVRQRVSEMLDLVGLSGSEDKYPAQLSGGQQQRVALARALAPSPSLLLLDEPMSALDAQVRERLRIELRALQKQLSITTLMVTHDQEEAMVMADRIAVMEKGRLVQFDRPQALYRSPADPFVAGFIGEANWLPYMPLEGAAVLVERARLDLSRDAPAAPGRLFIRPENIRVLDTASPAGAANTFLADIVDGVFLGRHYKLILRPEGMDGLTVQAIVNPEQGDRLLAPLAARRCRVQLPSEALHAHA